MDEDQKVEQALREARRAQVLSWIWWATVPVVSVVYWVVSKAEYPERAMLVLIADVSFMANAISYSGKQKAAEAKAAGYEHP